ncbi:hypothetical protein LZ31DRAFT_26640 [Colletotrichum somersetense]|nr:hypothetical protein LZ31DRAFT_26640 [Colletotrichum somersetense]
MQDTQQAARAYIDFARHITDPKFLANITNQPVHIPSTIIPTRVSPNEDNKTQPAEQQIGRLARHQASACGTSIGLAEQRSPSHGQIVSPTSISTANLAKYAGGQYDTMDATLPLFYDFYARTSIPSDQYGETIVVMLDDKPQEFYATHLRGYRRDHTALITQLKARFEGEEIHRTRERHLNHHKGLSSRLRRRC